MPSLDDFSGLRIIDVPVPTPRGPVHVLVAYRREAAFADVPREDDPDVAPLADRAESDAEARNAVYAAHYARIIENWDLTGPLRRRGGEVLVPEGERIPPTAENILAMPTGVLLPIVRAVIDDATRPGEQAPGQRG